MKNKINVFLIIVFFLLPLSYLRAQGWESLYKNAVYYHGSGKLETARNYILEAIEKAKKDFGKENENYTKSCKELILILEDLASYSLSMQQYDTAEEYLIDAKEKCREFFGEESIDYLRIVTELSYIYAINGESGIVSKYYSEVKLKSKKYFTGNSEIFIESLNKFAKMFEDMGSFGIAEEIYKEARKILKELSSRKSERYAIITANLALLYSNTGRFNEAEMLYDESTEILEKVLGKDHYEYAHYLNNLAIFERRMGRNDKAERMINDALNILRDENSRHKNDFLIVGKINKYFLQTQQNLGNLYFETKRYEEADSTLKKVLYFSKIFFIPSIYLSTLSDLASLYTRMGNYKKADSLYSMSWEFQKAEFDKNPLLYADCLMAPTLLYIKMERYDEAEQNLKKAKEIIKGKFGIKHPNYSGILDNLAGLYEIKGQYDMAEPLYKEINEHMLDLLSSSFIWLSEREKLQYSKLYEKYIEGFCSFVIKRIGENPLISEDMLNLELSIKGMILNSSFNIKSRILKSKDNLLIGLYDSLINIRSRISYAYTLPKNVLEKRGLDLTNLELKANAIEKELSRKSEDFSAEMKKSSITWNDIKANLKQDETAIDFINFRYFDKEYVDTTFYYALVVKKDSPYPKLIKLCTEKDLKEYLSSSSESKNSYVRNEEKSNGLYKLIWRPLEENLKDIGMVYLSPSGILNKVSFASLKVDENNLLIDKYKIRYLGNLKDIANKKDSESKEKLLTAALFGGIKYDVDSSIMVNNSMKYRSEEEISNLKTDVSLVLREETERSGWGYLKGTLTEVEMLKELLKKNTYEVKEYYNEDGSEEAFKSITGKKSPKVLHISTHGFFFPEPEKKYDKMIFSESKDIYKMSENPLFRSGLILAGANRVWKGGKEIEGIENGILTAYEVSNMDLQNTELVVLSACETGLGDIKGSEGVYGLQRAFKVAGAKTIIMSLWKVPDKETVELMVLIYTNWLEKKMTKQEAFTSAQKEMRKKYDPYYWAAFIMVE